PPQKLGPALRSLAKERGFQIVYGSKEVSQLDSPGAVGELTAAQALSRLLTGTGLTFEYLDEKTVTIVRANTLGATRQRSPTEAPPPAAPSGSRLQLAQETLGAPSGSSAVTSSSSETTVELQEVVVTAQKRTERLQDVPVPVAVLNADNLADTGQTRLQDYFSSVPGLTATGFGGATQLAIRGLSTGAGTNPTVGITVDDVPIGSSSLLGYGNQAPDIDPSDLARIEVLRGPQ